MKLAKRMHKHKSEKVIIRLVQKAEELHLEKTKDWEKALTKTKRRLRKPERRNQADSWTVDTLDCPQGQTNKSTDMARAQKSYNAQVSRTELASNYPDKIQMDRKGSMHSWAEVHYTCHSPARTKAQAENHAVLTVEKWLQYCSKGSFTLQLWTRKSSLLKPYIQYSIWHKL